MRAAQPRGLGSRGLSTCGRLSSAAKALNIENYGLVEGGAADFLVLDAQHIQEAVIARPKPRDVYKAGRLIASNGAMIAQNTGANAA